MGRHSNDVKFPGWVAKDGKTVLKADTTGVVFYKWLRKGPRCILWNSTALTEPAAAEAYAKLRNSDETQMALRGDPNVTLLAAGDHYCRFVEDEKRRERKSWTRLWKHVRHNFETDGRGRPLLLSSPICEERCLAVLKAIRSRNDKGVRLFSLRADGKRRRKSAGFRTSGGGKNYLTLLVAICNHAIRFMDVRTVPRLTGKVDFGEIAAREEHWTLEQRDAALAYLADHRDAEGRITLAHLFAFICIFTGSRKSAVTCLHWEKPTDGTRAPYVRFNHTTHEVLFDFGGWYAPSRKAKKKGGAKWCGGDRDARKRLIYDFMLLAWQQRRDGDAGRYVFGTWADKDHENKAPETAFRKVVESADFQAKVGKLPSNPHVLRHTYLTLGREAGVSCERLTEDTGANFKTILDNYAHLPRRESAREEDLAPQRSAVWGSSATDNIAVLPKREG